GGDPPVEGAQPAAPLVDGHVDRDVEPAADRFHVVRVDDHRLAELLGGPGELREDEDAIRRRAAATRHVFLGDQVHAITEGRDEGDVRSHIVRGELLTREGCIQILEGRAPLGREAAGDAADGLVDRSLHVAIVGQAVTGRYRDLYQADASPPLWPALEEAL